MIHAHDRRDGRAHDHADDHGHRRYDHRVHDHKDRGQARVWVAAGSKHRSLNELAIQRGRCSREICQARNPTTPMLSEITTAVATVGR